jgi:hypothetical protein
MPEYTFDMTLAAAITVTADSAEQAATWLREAIDCADTNFGAYPNGEPILGETSLEVSTLRLGMVDGKDYEPPLDEKWIRHAADHGAEFHEPSDGGKYWTAYDNNEDSWRVDASDRCTTKADAARVYCESEGCGEPDGVEPETDAAAETEYQEQRAAVRSIFGMKD